MTASPGRRRCQSARPGPCRAPPPSPSDGGATLPEPFAPEEVVAVCERLRNQPGFQTWYREHNQNRAALRFRELSTDLIAGIGQKLEDLTAAVDVHGTRFVNAIEDAKAVLEVAARSSDDSAVRAAQRAENWSYSFLNETVFGQRSGNLLLPYRRALDDMVFKGAGFLHLAFAPNVRDQLFRRQFTSVEEMIAELERAFDQGFSENPLVVECPALETVYFEPDLSTVAEIGRRTVSQVMASYELGYDPSQGFHWLTSDTMSEWQSDWDSDVTVYHLETEKYIYDVIAGARYAPFLVERRPNVAGRPWYAIFPGHVTNAEQPVKRFQPLIEPVYSLAQKINVLGTLLNSGALNTGRPMYQEVADRATGSDFRSILEQPASERPFITFDFSEQVLRKPRDRHHWELIPAPDMKWVVEAYADAQRQLVDWGFPIGISPEEAALAQANSGYQATQQMEKANRFLGPALKNTARSLSELLKLSGDVVRGLGVNVSIPVRRRAEGEDRRIRDLLTIKPEDFKEQDQEVRLEWVPATARVAVRESNMRMVQLGLMSLSTFMRGEYDDPLAERERIQIDKAKQFAEQKVLETVQMFIQQNAQLMASQTAAELGIPLPAGLAPPSGGPAPGETERFERPPEAAMPGVGAPSPVPEQPQGGVPPSVGTEAVAVAP